MVVVYRVIADTEAVNVETLVTPENAPAAVSMRQRLQQRPVGTVKPFTEIKDPQIAQIAQSPA